MEYAYPDHPGRERLPVPIEQGLQAFQAAQLRVSKSKLLYLPDENHWVKARKMPRFGNGSF